MKNIYYEKWRSTAIEYLGGKCAQCGTTVLLEFDHVDPLSKNNDVSKRWASSHLDLEELDKCQLLCHFHHVEKHRNRSHGTLTGYTHYKCRCEECKNCWRIHNNEYRRAKKARMHV